MSSELRCSALICIFMLTGFSSGQETVRETDPQKLESLLIVASQVPPEYKAKPEDHFASMAAWMAHLSKNQINAIQWIPERKAPNIFRPVASPHGRILLYTYDIKQAENKYDEFRIALPFQGLSYALTPPFLRRGAVDPFHKVRNIGAVFANGSTGGIHWQWAPDSKRIYLKLEKEHFIYSNGGAKQISITGYQPDVMLMGFAHDSNHVLFANNKVSNRSQYYIARLPERRDSITMDELYHSGTLSGLGPDYIPANYLNHFFSPSGQTVAVIGIPKQHVNSKALYVGPTSLPREVHLARGYRQNNPGTAAGTVLGQETLRGTSLLKKGDPYEDKYCDIQYLGWTQDGQTLYYLLTERLSQGKYDSPIDNDHRITNTVQLWKWNAARGAAKVIDAPVLLNEAMRYGCPISYDERYLIFWGSDLPPQTMNRKEYASYTSISPGDKGAVQWLYAIDLKNKTLSKVRRRHSQFDFAAFTKPERFEGEIFPGLNAGNRGEELPDNFIRFTSPIEVADWQNQWALQLHFEGNVTNFASRRGNLSIEATFHHADGTPLRDTDGWAANRDGATAVGLSLKTATLNVSADAFRNHFYVPLNDLELVAHDKTDLDVTLKLFEGDKLLGQTKPASRVSISHDRAPRVWFKNPKVELSTENGVGPGIHITAEAWMHELTAWDVRFEAVVKHPDLKSIPAKTAVYRGTDHTAAATTVVRPTKKDQNHAVRMFIPLSELQLNSGERTVSVQLQARILEKNFVGASRQYPLTFRMP